MLPAHVNQDVLGNLDIVAVFEARDLLDGDAVVVAAGGAGLQDQQHHSGV